MADLITKNDLLEKLRSYRETQDDETIRYKNKIKDALIKCPELLYALNEGNKYELFDEYGNINWDPKTHEPYGNWGGYFGEKSNIRNFLFIPDAQTEQRNYLCYQVRFTDVPKYNNIQKYTEVVFTTFCFEQDIQDPLTGIARHDLISSIIRENFNWSSIFGMQAKLVSSKESTTDNHYLVRTLVFEILDINGITYTPYGESTLIRNTDYWQ